LRKDFLRGSHSWTSTLRPILGVRNLGVRLGNWLSDQQSLALWQAPNVKDLKGKRDRALLALLLACGLCRHEAVALRLEHLENNGRDTGPSSI
jgi:site-specific recombinase XerD